MVNNLSPNITNERRFILIKLILIGFFVWFFSSVLVVASREIEERAERWMIWEDLMEGDWLTFMKFLHPSRLLEGNIRGIIFTIGLMIGLYLGLKKAGKAIFFYPIISFCIFGFLLGILSFLGAFLIPFLPFFPTGFVGQAFIFLCFSLIISTFFYFKKENLLFAIAGLILIALIGGSVVMGKYYANKLSSERKELENKLITLKEKAIETGNPELCEEIEKILKEKKTLNEGGIVHAWGDMADYYQPCIEEVAIKIGDETLCERIRKVVSGSPIYQCRKMVKALKTNNIEECAEICKCVTYFAVNANNPDICEKCEYYSRDDCFSKLALINGDPKICERILQLRYYLGQTEHSYDRCITDIAVKQNNPELCKKVKEAYYFRNEEKVVTFTIDKCLEEVRLTNQ